MFGRATAAATFTVMIATAALSGCSQDKDASPDEVVALSSAPATSAPTGSATEGAKPKKKAKVKGAKKANKVTIRVLPQIVQPGAKVASASAAKTAVTVQVSPKRRTVVTLQVKAGNKWKKVKTEATGKNGKHVFAANARRGGKAATYRVVVGKRASAAASTAPWLKADFTDDFKGGLSRTWSHQGQKYNPGGMRACSKGATKAAGTTGGTLRLSVLKDTAKKSKCTAMRNGKSSGKFAYRLNGNVSTKDKYSFKYGVAAARMKFPRAMGQHGSFWLQPQVHVSGTVNPKLTGAEIDVVESFGERYSKKYQGMSSFTYHWTLKGNSGVKVKTGGYIKNTRSFLAGKNDNWWDRYHVFSVEWTPTQYIFRIDGQETWRSSKGISGQPQYLVLSLLSSDYELSLLKGDKNLPQHMNVDWVRVWETGS